MVEFDPTLRTRLSKYLTAELLDELPNTTAITQAIQNLNSLHKAIASFLPQYIAQDEEHLMDDYGKLSQGTFMFADVSGFTALSEQLMRKAGPDGIEILTDIINDYFSTMLEILAKSEGQLLKFAGDALLTFFPAVEGQDEFPKAVNAGLRMQRDMAKRFQPIQSEHLTKWFGQHNLQLTMSIGISRGKLFEALVGNINQRDHMIMGKLPGEADAAEKAGVRDEVIIPAAMQAEYAHMFETKQLTDGFYQVVDNFGEDLGDFEFSMPQRRRAKSSFLFSFDEAQLVQDLQNELTRVEVISRFVSSEIVNKLVVRGDHIESENRLATVIFVHFTGFAELLEAWGEDNVDNLALLLSQYYSTMQRTIATHGGVLTRSDPYSLGSKLLITFGAPVAHADDPDRAVQTTLDMHRQLEIFNKRLREDLPSSLHHLYPFIQQRMGITLGNVFAGEVGWRQRREYTVMGDDVNLAARLMSRAEFGQVIVSKNVWERVRAYFETETLPPFSAKGKTEPIQSYAIKGVIRHQMATTSNTPFIGRDVILMSLNMALHQAERAPKKVRAIALHGEIGVGKTRIAKELAISAQTGGFKVAWVTCRSQNGPKTTWASIISQLLDLDRTAPPDIQRQDLKTKLAALQLADVEEVFADFLFEVDGQSQQAPPPPTRQRTPSKSTTDIFRKISGDEATRSLDEGTSFRQRLKKRTASDSSNLPWRELQMGMTISEALVKFLHVLSQEHKLLIILDDLHKENQRALHRLKRLLDEISGARVMLITTYDPSKDPQVDMHKIAVSDLPEDQTLLMASAILNGSALGANLAKFITNSTNGRALFIESLIQTLLDAEQLVEEQGVYELKPDANVDELPDNVRGLVISRIDRLSNEARQIVRAAAVLEDDFTLDELVFVSEMTDLEAVHALVEQLLKLQLFEDNQDGTYRFQHGVTQQAVYEELTRLQRQKFHLRVAGLYGESENPDHIRKMVHHLQRAGNPTRAVALITEAAKRAEANGNLDQAVECYTIALEILPDDRIQEQLNRLKQLQRE
jgi:class 3 adenylate cyclase